MDLQSWTQGRLTDRMAGGTIRPGDGLRDTVIRNQEELARMAEEAEDEFLGPVGTDRITSQAPHHFDLSTRSNQGQGTRVQASRDQDQQTPG